MFAHCLAQIVMQNRVSSLNEKKSVKAALINSCLDKKIYVKMAMIISATTKVEVIILKN